MPRYRKMQPAERRRKSTSPSLQLERGLLRSVVWSSFALGLAGRLQRDNFTFLDAPIEIVGSVDTPAIPLNSDLELALLPNADKIKKAIDKTLKF